MPWTTSTLRVAGAGLGAAVAGPLGGALGGWLADALGAPATELIRSYTEKFSEKAGEKFLDTGIDSLSERLKQASPRLEDVYREALRLSLLQIYESLRHDGFDDWFANWQTCLADTGPLPLESVGPEQIAPAKLDDLFRRTMETLDAQGAALTRGSTSLALRPRPIPDALFSELTARLPDMLPSNFRTLLVKPENDQAWKQIQLVFQDFSQVTLGRIDANVATLQGIIENQLVRALEDGRLARQQEQAARSQVEALTAELQTLRQQVAGRPSEPGKIALSDFLRVGDLEGALRVKSDQIEARRGEVDNLAHDWYELGVIHEIRFAWSEALAAYQEAWRLKRNPEYGFKFALLAQRQNHFQDAAETYRAVLSTYRELAQANPAAYLPDVAMTLNNLAILYRDTQRMTAAEEAYQEALSTYRELAQANPAAYLPNVAMALNNLANLYSATQRMTAAEEAYREALSTYRELAQANPAAYLPNVATTLNNLAVLYRATQRMTAAEEAYQEALSLRRELAQANPAAYLPDVATTLNNLANLYSDTQRMTAAEEAYQEALSTYRELAQANPAAYLPNVAMALNNLALHYRATQRTKLAEEYCSEAETSLEPFWRSNPLVHGDQMARIFALHATVCENDPTRLKEACAWAQRALSAAYRPDIKHLSEALVNQYCDGG